VVRIHPVPPVSPSGETGEVRREVTAADDASLLLLLSPTDPNGHLAPFTFQGKPGTLTGCD